MTGEKRGAQDSRNAPDHERFVQPSRWRSTQSRLCRTLKPTDFGETPKPDMFGPSAKLHGASELSVCDPRRLRRGATNMRRNPGVAGSRASRASSGCAIVTIVAASGNCRRRPVEKRCAAPLRSERILPELFCQCGDSRC